MNYAWLPCNTQVGFVTGADGLGMLRTLWLQQPWWATAATVGVLHCAALLMFGVREREAAAGGGAGTCGWAAVP